MMEAFLNHFVWRDEPPTVRGRTQWGSMQWIEKLVQKRTRNAFLVKFMRPKRRFGKAEPLVGTNLSECVF
jgi:hypothetical protein